VPGHTRVSDDQDPLASTRLWSRGNSAYGGGEGNFVADAGLGIKVGSMKATGAQRTQMLLLSSAGDWQKPIDPYVFSKVLYIVSLGRSPSTRMHSQKSSIVSPYSKYSREPIFESFSRVCVRVCVCVRACSTHGPVPVLV
jgi:hypothetical protein